MKRRILLRRLRMIFAIASIGIFFESCDDDEKQKTEPLVTTAAITDVTATTASGGGEVVSNGNSEITVSGLVYSSTNAIPTLSDSKTEETVASGTFSSLIENLTPSTTYHVRAYATNSVGTGYGAIVNFTTGNAAPTATNVSISGTVRVNEQLTASYTFNDAEGDNESGTVFQWYRADNGSGASEIAIEGATEFTYHLQDIDEFKYIRVGITVKAATGTTTGKDVKSIFIGPVEEATSVTFTYNGEVVTYGIVTSSVTGRKWLDRNLGAPSTPTSYSDYANYGDAFQWGRAADGHQLINRGATSAETTGVNGTTDVLSSSDTPNHGLFILNPSGVSGDWQDPQNDNLWQGVNGVNNPCPQGWRIPTKEEWQLENLNLLDAAYSQLKITAGGLRRFNDGAFTFSPSRGYYWSSSVTSDSDKHYSYIFTFKTTEGTPESFVVRGYGALCRCIRE